MSRGGQTLYVTGFSHGTRARDLAYEFERPDTAPSVVVLVIAVLALVSRPSRTRLRPPAFTCSLSSSRPSMSRLAPFRNRSSLELYKARNPRASAHGIPFSKGGPVGAAYGRLVRCDIPAPRSTSSRLFAFVEYEDRRDADDAYHEMHNKRIGRDDILKIEWARTPPSASWRFESGRDRERRGAGGSGGERSERPARSPRRGRSPSPRRSTRDYSPRKDERRDRDRDDYREGGRRDRDRSRSPDPRSDRERDPKEDRDDRDRRENGTNGDERKDTVVDSPPPPPVVHDDLDIE
ncbi:hypothetical protein G7046_g9378 [Stylonectria norvegica]|nr:hypothetical protein G7046_g9378 [Stylonectria norvegica]